MGGKYNYKRICVLFTTVLVQKSHRAVSPLRVVYEHVSFVCIYHICVHLLKRYGSLTHARALSVTVPHIGNSMASYKEVYQTLAEERDNK